MHNAACLAQMTQIVGPGVTISRALKMLNSITYNHVL